MTSRARTGSPQWWRGGVSTKPRDVVNQANRPSDRRRVTVRALGPAHRAGVSTPYRPMTRRAAFMALVGAALAACAGIGLREPLRVNLVGIESLPGEGMEARFLARIRVQNPNDLSIRYSGLSAELDLNGRTFASGVSDVTGEIPRFGEAVLALPLTVPATAIVRQLLGLIGGDLSRATYRVRGFLYSGTFGRAGFDSTGEIELPKPEPPSE